ncbi:MAG TPA: VWA domain-containing protein [Pyrinomonadaceae bacterium]|nr:VWA domain-containing protein [Pyrinomonadaceae bacterium]
MNTRRAVFLLALTLLFAADSGAQSGRVQPPAKPSPTPAQSPAGADAQQPDVRVFTEEVRVPVFARDQYGRFDPSLERDDVLVLEDGVPQQVRSIRRIPAHVLLVLNTGGELNPGQRTNTTRQMALNLINHLREGDSVAVIQFNRRTELIQPWTADLEAARHTLRSKLSTGTGARHAEALNEAARLFADQPLGNRHVVLLTDGVETPGGDTSPEELIRILTDASVLGGRAGYAEAYRRLQAAQVSVHVVGTGTLGRRVEKEKSKKAPAGPPPGSVAASGVAVAGVDPRTPPTVNRGGGIGPGANGGAQATIATVNFDPAMRRLRKRYESAQKRGEQQMRTLTLETGGRILLPASDEELVAQGEEVAREIGTQYVVTYSPKRALAEAPPTEYRRLTVTPRRSGLELRSRRGYVAAGMTQQEAKDE